jgi:hypothetical protein
MTPEQWLVVGSLAIVYGTGAATFIYYYTGNRYGARERKRDVSNN